MRSLATKHFLPAIGDHIKLVPSQILRESSRGGVTDGQALAVSVNPVTIRHTNTRGGAVPGEDNVAGEIDLRQIRQLTIASLKHTHIVQLQLLGNIRRPASTKAFPNKDIRAACAEQRPKRHFNRARVGCRNDADAIVRRHIEHLTRQIDRLLQLCLANFCTVGATQWCVGQAFKRPARTLRAWARRE